MKILTNLSAATVSEGQPARIHAAAAVAVTSPVGAMQQVQLGMHGVLISANGEAVFIPVAELVRAAELAEPKLAAPSGLKPAPAQ